MLFTINQVFLFTYLLISTYIQISYFYSIATCTWLEFKRKLQTRPFVLTRQSNDVQSGRIVISTKRRTTARKEVCTNSRIELLTRTNKSAGTNSDGLVRQLRDLARIQRRRNLEFMWIVVSIATAGNFETGKLEFFSAELWHDSNYRHSITRRLNAVRTLSEEETSNAIRKLMRLGKFTGLDHWNI